MQTIPYTVGGSLISGYMLGQAGGGADLHKVLIFSAAYGVAVGGALYMFPLTDNKLILVGGSAVGMYLFGSYMQNNTRWLNLL